MLKIVLAAFNSKYIHSALGLRSVAAFCRARGRDAKVMEFTLQTPPLSALAQVYQEKPDVVGISVHIWNLRLSLRLAALVKKVLPEALVILGGPEVTYGAADILAGNPAVDAIVQGEGEEVFAALLADISQGGRGQGVTGLAVRTADGGVDLQGGAQVVEDLSVLPFAYDDIKQNDNINKIIYYESSRGCPFACSYCLSGRARSVRYKPLEQVFAEIQRLLDTKVKQIKFVDRTYNLNKQHYLPLMRWLAGRDTQTNFHFEIKADNLDEEDIIFLTAVPPGRFQLEIGVQSTHEAALQAVGRRDDWGKLARNVQRLRAAGNIHLHLDLIAGLPYESLEKFGQSFRAVYSLRPHILQLGFLKLLKGTELAARAAAFGYIAMPGPPYEVLANDFINYSQLRRLKILEEVFELTYNSGRFEHTLAFLLEKAYARDPFILYMELAGWWEGAGIAFIAHNAKTVLSAVAEFIKERHGALELLALDCLKLDILLYQDKNLRPDFLYWQDKSAGGFSSSFWRQPGMVEKYLPGYIFTSWRKAHNTYEIECFRHYFPVLGRLDAPLAVLLEKENKGRPWQIIDGVFC